MNPKIAVVILNWNGEKLLRQFLPSVIKNSRQDNVAIFVADNGSDDDSPEIIKNDFPEVSLLPLNENHGFALGYNIALRQIEADYYILLNSDVEVTPDWINPMINIMERNASVAVVQPKIKSWHEKEKFEYAGAAGGFIDWLGFPFCRGRVLNVTEKDEGQFDDEIRIFWTSGACMAIRADVFSNAGGFDSDFWAHMEEIDLCWRLQNLGYQIFFTPLSTVYHLGGGTLSYNNPRKLYLNFRNSLFMLYKNLPRKKFIPVFICRQCVDGAGALKFLLEGNINAFKSVWNAHINFYKALPSLRKKRIMLQQNRVVPKIDLVCRKSLVWRFYFKNKKTFAEIAK